ncbi:molybdate ABC transporter substrate-binding protein [Alteromonas antoniana]|uniref:molybdate ABC transporter substrate-binding protein n=1 Tax=Alteromonas antoniana TaxID=2803813 RepID=UPI001C47B14B|nr:molybdate ABC transporter substrate-binding protein [Alteromonas antoniana]
MHKWIVVVLVSAIVAVSPTAWSEPSLKLAVAANFAEPLRAIATQYEQQSSVKSAITVASSGTLFAQLQHGADIDVFFSADRARPQALLEKGRVQQSDVHTYAFGRLAYLDRSQTSPSLNDLKTYALSPGTRIAIANPRLAPYGQAAQDTLQQLTLWPQLSARLVKGKNVLQAYQYYASGNVDRALVAWSLVVNDNAHVFLIPKKLHRPIEQQLAVTAREENRSAARAFVDFVLSPAVQSTLSDWGYEPVDDSTQ